MTYEDVRNLKSGDFKRLCGVTIETFARIQTPVSLTNFARRV